MAVSHLATVYGTGLVLGNDGVVVTHGLTITNGDLLVAFCGAGTANVGAGGETITGFAASGWTAVPSSFDAQAGGNDRAMEWLYKVASGEGPTWTFTRTNDTVSRNQVVGVMQLSGQHATPLDTTIAISQGTNSATPNAPDITTTTDACLLITGSLISYGDTESQSGDSAGAPSGWTLAGSPSPFDGNSTTTPRGILLAMAYKTAGAAGVQSGAAWTHSGLDGTQEYEVATLAIRAAATASGFDGSRSMRGLRNLRSLNGL